MTTFDPALVVLIDTSIKRIVDQIAGWEAGMMDGYIPQVREAVLTDLDIGGYVILKKPPNE